MFTLIFLALLAFVVWYFRKPINAWLTGPNDPLADEVTKLESEAPVFGKRAVPPAASVGDPDVSKPKV